MDRREAINFLHKSRGYSRRMSAKLVDFAIKEKEDGPFASAIRKAIESELNKNKPTVYIISENHYRNNDEVLKGCGGGGPQEKMHKVMKKFKKKTLHSGSKKGPVVKDRDQAIAIGLSESGQSKSK